MSDPDDPSRPSARPPDAAAPNVADLPTESLGPANLQAFIPPDRREGQLLEGQPPRRPDRTASESAAGRVDRDRELLSRHPRFRLEKLIGEGGMGKVYRAFDVELARPVALKVLFATDREADARFAREAQAQARVDHPHVGKVYETGSVDGRRFIAMQYIEGETLVSACAGMTREERVRVMQQICEGVHAAHRIGLVHRDIKPANVLVARDPDGGFHPYVVDFGIARESGATHTAAITGTPSYMAPEQIIGGDVDRRTDVYALGVTLYQVLSGDLPIRGTSPADVLNKVIHDEPRPLRQALPSVPRDLENVVMKCLEKDPARRYESARALAEDLGRFLDGEPVAARRVSLVYRLGKRARKHRALVGTVALALLAVAVLGALAIREAVLGRRLERLAAGYGQEAERMEWMLRAEREMPIHDTRPLEDRLRSRLAQIRSEVARASTVERGPGLYALGRGLLALGDDLEAEAPLDQAWRAGMHDASVAFWRGKAKTLALKRALDHARLLPDGTAREAAIAQADALYRDEAVRMLRLGQGAPLVENDYGRALLAWAQGLPDVAIASARSAIEVMPFLYDAYLLIGDAELEQARASTDAVSRTGAEQRAATAYAEAARIGQSDPRPYQRLCELELERAKHADDRASARQLAGAALEHCRQARMADSRDELAREFESEAQRLISAPDSANGSPRAR